MEQKQVKIIGLKVNQKFGILQSCNIEFDEKNKLISVKGEVGSGKTTLQKSLQLGTLGSDTLKSDKNLYGNIDQEVILSDGNIPVFVGCKSGDNSKLIYSIYTKDSEGKKINDPIIDGVKLTPSKYLDSLQTALTWRMEELTSENPTIQKKILLDLYKEDLSKAGVVYDKSNPNYVDSILDKIEKAEAIRSEKEFLRKQNGGFSKHLLEHGYNVDKPETLPSRINIDLIRKEENQLSYEIDNSLSDFESKKEAKLKNIKNESEEIILILKNYNMDMQTVNSELSDHYNSMLKRFSEGIDQIKEVCIKITNLTDQGIISEELRTAIIEDLNKRNDLCEPSPKKYEKLIEFDEKGVCITENSQDPEINERLNDLKRNRELYTTEMNKSFKGDNSAKEQALLDLKGKIIEAESNNKICNAVDSFNEWREANETVQDLKKEYARKLKEINTGLEGLTIELEEVGEKMNVHLMYDGTYNPKYFSNLEKESRKLSSYSGTQKPMICLLIQNYLLNKKPKALRYLWIDNVPIDNKTKDLLNLMGEKLNLTIFINITGDFEIENLESGEILLEGGEVFFN